MSLLVGVERVWRYREVMCRSGAGFLGCNVVVICVRLWIPKGVMGLCRIGVKFKSS